MNVTFTNMINGRFNNDGNSANWGGTAADPYYSLGADDIYFHGQAADLSVTFTGLDPSLGYNARIYSLIGNNAGTIEGFVATDGAGTRTTQSTRGVRWSAPTLESGATVFSDLRANASNEVVVTVQDVGNVYYPLNAIVLEAVPLVSRVLQRTWDFETGTLEGWTVLPGSNFDTQPTNSTRTNFNRSGDWHLGSTETDDNAQGWNDTLTGIIESPQFTLGDDAILEMLVGGGAHPWSGTPDAPGQGITAVNLERLVNNAWEVLHTVTGINNNAMRAVSWDLSEYAGEQVRLRMYDQATGGWGNISLDNVRVYGNTQDIIPEPCTLALLGLGGLALLRRRRRS